MHVRSKDQVVVISGDDKGKQGTVLTAFPKEGRVIVEGVALVKKHQKPRRQDEPGGIITKESTISASNVMLICPKCSKPTRVGHTVAQVEGRDGVKKMKSVRVCKKCNAQIDQ
ncbi:MAG: 50S ribosomal protein L24 [Clostridiales bacterium]|nr:50S ribosomal protein L24 [Clostridiales bacterium]